LISLKEEAHMQRLFGATKCTSMAASTIVLAATIPCGELTYSLWGEIKEKL
jgi:hypothetical protein